MPISPFLADLRRKIGTDLLVLPAVTVLPRDDQGRVLLVRLADTGRWGTIGGAVEPDEPPTEAAVREAQEEAGVRVELRGLLAAIGGLQLRLTYPNGDQVSYVTVVYDARVRAGAPVPDHEETTDVRWVQLDELPGLELEPSARYVLQEVGLISAEP